MTQPRMLDGRSERIQGVSNYTVSTPRKIPGWVRRAMSRSCRRNAKRSIKMLDSHDWIASQEVVA